MQINAITPRFAAKPPKCCCEPETAPVTPPPVPVDPVSTSTPLIPGTDMHFMDGLVTAVGGGLTAIGITSPYAPFVAIGAGAAIVTYGAYKGTRKLISMIARRRTRSLNPVVAK